MRIAMNPFLLLFSFLLIVGCSQKTDESVDSDPCANAAGNGHNIIAGPSGPTTNDFDQVFRSLEIDPANPDIVYLGTERNGIVKTIDGGITWQRLRDGMRHSTVGYPEVWDIAVSPSNPSLVIAATADSPGPIAGDYPSSMAGVYRSVDGGLSWMRSNCGISNSYALSVRFDPNDSTSAILGIGSGTATFSALQGQSFDGVLMRSNDSGLSWNATSMPAGANTNVFWLLRAYGNGLTQFITFALCPDDLSKNLGFLRSEDGGRSWNPMAPQLREQRIVEFDVSRDGRRLYAIERDTFSLRTSTDSGASWDTLAVPANGPIRMSPDNPDNIIFCDYDKIYHSTNGLQSWHLVLTTADRVDDVAFAPAKPDVIYLATRGYSIYKSSDFGATWIQLINLRTAGVLD